MCYIYGAGGVTERLGLASEEEGEWGFGWVNGRSWRWRGSFGLQSVSIRVLQPFFYHDSFFVLAHELERLVPPSGFRALIPFLV